MSRRKDRGAAVLEFFETAPPDAAAAVLGICKSIVKRRLAGARATATAAAPGAADDLTPAQAAGISRPGSES